MWFYVFLTFLYMLHSVYDFNNNNSYYLRQVNEVNGGDNVFVRCVSVRLSVCVCVRSGRSWELNANSSKTVKAKDLKFDISLPRDSPDMTRKIFPKGGVARVTWPLNFWALNANNSKTIKATDLKFDKSVPRPGSPDMTAKNFSKSGRGQGHVTPQNFSALNANTWRRYALLWAPSSFICITLSQQYERCANCKDYS